MDFYFYSAIWNIYGPLAPSSHEMSYKPFLGSMNPKIQKDEEMEENKCGMW